MATRESSCAVGSASSFLGRILGGAAFSGSLAWPVTRPSLGFSRGGEQLFAEMRVSPCPSDTPLLRAVPAGCTQSRVRQSWGGSAPPNTHTGRRCLWAPVCPGRLSRVGLTRQGAPGAAESSRESSAVAETHGTLRKTPRRREFRRTVLLCPVCFYRSGDRGATVAEPVSRDHCLLGTRRRGPALGGASTSLLRRRGRRCPGCGVRRTRALKPSTGSLGALRPGAACSALVAAGLKGRRCRTGRPPCPVGPQT